MATTVFFLVLIALLVPNAASWDPDPLQDTCVADLSSTIKVNGFVCKSNSSADDFSSSVLAKPGNISTKLGSAVTTANVLKFPGVNTLGISGGRVDFAPGGLNPPHIHPRGTELLFLIEGSLYVGFITTENKLFAKTIEAGELFVFPRGLVHFQLNVGQGYAIALAGFNSQNAGTLQVARALFESSPAVENAVLEKAFQIDDGEVKHLREVISKT